MNIEVLLIPAEERGFTVTCPILKGCISEGDTKEEALENIKDAINLYLRAVKKEELLEISRHKGSELCMVAINA